MSNEVKLFLLLSLCFILNAVSLQITRGTMEEHIEEHHIHD